MKNTIGRIFPVLMGQVIIITVLFTGIVLGGTGAITAPGEWTWVSGSATVDQTGTYGTKGTPAASNIPGGRTRSISWVDARGDFWLFGGWDGGNAEMYGPINDLWRYDTTSGEWTWMSGNDTANQPGTYGTKGTPAASNIPGGRVGSNSWVDAEGNFWLFGGWGYDSAVTDSRLNDLWRYNTTSGEWTWLSGSDTVDQAGTYGTKGTPAAANIPGNRWGSISWVDAGGGLWLFGGGGYEIANNEDRLNDLWCYNTTSGEWTWLSGSETVDQPGTYGTKGTPAAANIPGARRESISWLDTVGDFWLFGGYGYGSTSGLLGRLNDLWRYDTTTGEWTWLSGSETVDQAGTYGTKGTPAASNIPGARYVSVSWVDAVGDFWLFGGSGRDSAGIMGYLNDLWHYNTTTGEWTWVSGSDTRNQAGTYGTKGTSMAANIPGNRWGSISWVDAGGNLWLFGGASKDSHGSFTFFNDLWHFDTTPSVSTTTGWSLIVFSVTLIAVILVKRHYRKSD